MRTFLRSAWLLLMIPGLAYGQTAPHTADSATANTSDVGAQLDALREALLQTQQQVAAQHQEIQVLEAQLKSVQPSTAGGALIPAVEIVRPNPAPTNANPSDFTPDARKIVVNPVSPSADQPQQGDQQTPVGLHQTRRSGSHPRRIRRLRECISHHEHPEQHRHQFRRHSFQQHCTRSCH